MEVASRPVLFLLVKGFAATAPHLGAGECAGVPCRALAVAAQARMDQSRRGRISWRLSGLGKLHQLLALPVANDALIMVAIPQFASLHRHAAPDGMLAWAPGLPEPNPSTSKCRLVSP